MGFAPGSPVGKELPKVQFGSLPRDTEGHGTPKDSTSKAQLVTVERSGKCECKGICCCKLNEVMALCKATELEECFICGGCIEDERSKEQARQVWLQACMGALHRMPTSRHAKPSAAQRQDGQDLVKAGYTQHGHLRLVEAR